MFQDRTIDESAKESIAAAIAHIQNTIKVQLECDLQFPHYKD